MFTIKPQSKTIQNVLTLAAGGALAQAIPILITPVLTRIYTPEDFGVFALYMSILAIIASFITGKYELAILLAKTEKEAANTFILTITIVTLLSSFLLTVIIIFNENLTDYLGKDGISQYLYLLPVSAFLTGLFQSYNYWNTRNKGYKKITINKICQSLSTGSINIGMGLFNSSGLIIGHVFGQLVSIALFTAEFHRNKYLLISQYDKKAILISIKKNIDFPLYNVPHNFLNNLSVSLPILLLGHYSGMMVAGFYLLADKIVSAPMSIIAASYSQVFYQEISDLKKQNEKQTEIKYMYNKTVFNLFLYISPLVFIFFIISPPLFSFVFGPEWQVAGVYSQILIPMIFVRFVGGIVSPVVIIYKKQFTGFTIEIVNTSVSFFALLLGALKNDFMLGLILFSTTRTIISIVRLFWYARIIK